MYFVEGILVLWAFFAVIKWGRTWKSDIATYACAFAVAGAVLAILRVAAHILNTQHIPSAYMAATMVIFVLLSSMLIWAICGRPAKNGSKG